VRYIHWTSNKETVREQRKLCYKQGETWQRRGRICTILLYSSWLNNRKKSRITKIAQCGNTGRKYCDIPVSTAFQVLAESVEGNYKSEMGLTNNPIWERCLQKDESATHILCDCEAIAYLKFYHLSDYFMETGDKQNAPLSNRYYSSFGVYDCWRVETEGDVE
jgi:hypothetical protein